MAKTEQGSSRMDTVLKMLLIAFVSLLAFSSGVYFGKQMSDSDHQLKALESDFNQPATFAAENGDGEEAVSEKEVASLSDKYVNAEKEAGERTVASTDEHAAPAKAEAPAAHGEKAVAKHEEKTAKHEEAAEEHEAKAPAHETSAHEAPKATGHAAAAPTTGKPDLSAAHRAAERVANNAAPVSETKAETKAVPESRVPTSLPKTVGANNVVEFTVQVASYPTAGAAKEHADALVKKGFAAFPVEATINGRTWYRVSVGSFKTMKDATTYRAQLLKQADVQNAIVQKITR